MKNAARWRDRARLRPTSGSTAIAVLALLPACSGLDTMPYVGGSPGITGGAESFNPVRYTLIDDMESSTGLIAWTPPAGSVAGSWDTYADVQCADVSPMSSWDPDHPGGWSYAEVPQPYETFRGLFSRHAARVRTLNPLADTWGAGMGFYFALRPSDQNTAGLPDTRPCTKGQVVDAWVPVIPVDLSNYGGITFWAMAARHGTTTVHVEFIDRNTTPEAGVCLGANLDLSKCYNGFGVYIDLTDTFTRYTVDFASLAQSPSWGYHPTPDVIDLAHVYGLNFQMETPSAGACDPKGPIICAAPSWVPTVSFDFWIDDLYFIHR